jgi:hypothetical protein
VHEEVELGLWPLPILAGQAVQGQLFDVQTRAFLDSSSHAGHTLTMPLDPREVLPFRPTTVAIHNHGDVPGTTICVDTQFGGGSRSGSIRHGNTKGNWVRQ